MCEFLATLMLFLHFIWLRLNTAPGVLAKDMMAAGLTFLVMIIVLSVALSFVVHDKNKTELLCNFWLFAYQIIFGIFGPIYYILKTPTAKKYFLKKNRKVPLAHVEIL